MKHTLLALHFVLALSLISTAQTNEKPATPVWTEADRKYLLDNLIRTKQELLDETKNLTKKQWNFKESPDRWSINQIVEHLAIWELLLMREISVAINYDPIPTYEHFLQDSLFEKGPKSADLKNALDYTKPFTYAIPLGNNEGKNNITWIMTMRDESIEYLKTTTKNLRVHYICFGPNVHQNYMMIFGHTDRHLRQLRKVKTHPNYPK